MPSAVRVYLTMVSLIAFANTVMFTTYAVYYINTLDFNPLQLILVGVALEITVFLCEIPTGIVADVYGRRLSVIIGCFVLGLAFVLEGSALYISVLSFIAMVILAEIIRGVGETFVSGAQGAWITDEVGEDNVGKLFLRARQITLGVEVIGIGVSVALASYKLNAPFIVGGLTYLVLGIFLLMKMKETNFIPAIAERGNRNTLKVISNTLMSGIKEVKKKHILLMLTFVTFFVGASSEGFDRLWELHFIDSIGLPKLGGLSTVVWFGIISIGSKLIGIGVAEVARRKLDTRSVFSVNIALLLLTSIKIVFIFLFGASVNFPMALTSFWALTVIGTIYGPIFDTWLNQNIDSKVRSTVLSLMSQVNAFGQTAGSPFIGTVGVRYTVRAALILAAVLLIPAFIVFARMLKLVKNSSSKTSGVGH
ncbi:major facilitator superfamily MFS_1 [Paenibacillus curdlanolyticus YK9]|uniref:Major facilitator superfamily MFS_1 n=1 Tax=Paenibacillus curdlanolyticus YK9 TaxID=717606 RepID=E0I743_9BACL|nr:MFS transporter [Paenibacillus curdlanolyticus]EFM11859.1 major facilitator superfamily MFS_1 [Paenibacillus curdlanolyticus YK9]